MSQFGSFDGKDNRKEVMYLMGQIGYGLPERDSKVKRARFLQSLIPLSITSMAAQPLIVNPDECDIVGAYHLFVAITGVLGVPIEQAARMLDKYVSRHKLDGVHLRRNVLA